MSEPEILNGPSHSLADNDRLVHSHSVKNRDEFLATAPRVYDIDEQILAAYAMGTGTFGNFTVIGGLRVERTEQDVTWRASDLVLPSSDVYQALDKGVIDATDYSVPTLNYALGLHKVAKYFNYPGFHSLPQGDFVVNKKAWDALPPDIQAILKTAVRDWCIDFSQRLRISDSEAVTAMKAAGAEPIQWSEENLAKARAIVSEVWDEWAKKSPECAEAIKLQRDFIKKLGR